jgi:hypothetical protein
MKKPPAPGIAQGTAIGQQQQNTGQSNINAGLNTTDQAVSNPTGSPLYKALYNTEVGQMSKAYDSASANTTAQARQAGFGYQQPVAQGAQDQLRGQEASAIGQLPGQVASQSVPLEMQAGQQQTQAGISELGQGNSLYGQAALGPLEQQYQQYSQNYQPLWQRALAGGIKGFLPGGSGALQGALGAV